jgi:hypothetical protein
VGTPVFDIHQPTTDIETSAAAMTTTGHNINLPSIDGIEFVDYIDERQLEDVMRLVGQDLSEPYSGEDFTLSFLPTLNNFIEQIILSHMNITYYIVCSRALHHHNQYSPTDISSIDGPSSAFWPCPPRQQLPMAMMMMNEIISMRITCNLKRYVKVIVQ